MIKFIKKLGRTNGLLKPVSVMLSAGGPLGYLLSKSNNLVIENIDPETVAVSKNLISGLNGSLILLVILLAIIQTYKPPKGIVISLVVGGLMLFGSSLLYTLGITFLLFGLGNLVNQVTLNRLIIRNNEVKNLQNKSKVEEIVRSIR